MNPELGCEIAEKKTGETVKGLNNEQLGMEIAWAVGWCVGTGHNGLEYGKERNEKCEPVGEYKPCALLCESLDAIAEIEKAIDEKGLRMDYYRALQNISAERWIKKGWSFDLDELDSVIATASARQRAEAVYAVLKGLED